MNDRLPFGTNFDRVGRFLIVERFLMAASDIETVIEPADQDSAKMANELVDENKRDDWSYPLFDVIMTFYQSISHAQTMLEASESPTLVMVLTVTEELRRKLRLSDKHQSMIQLHVHDQSYCTVILYDCNPENSATPGYGSPYIEDSRLR